MKKCRCKTGKAFDRIALERVVPAWVLDASLDYHEWITETEPSVADAAWKIILRFAGEFGLGDECAPDFVQDWRVWLGKLPAGWCVGAQGVNSDECENEATPDHLDYFITDIQTKTEAINKGRGLMQALRTDSSRTRASYDAKLSRTLNIKILIANVDGHDPETTTVYDLITDRDSDYSRADFYALAAIKPGQWVLFPDWGDGRGSIVYRSLPRADAFCFRCRNGVERSFRDAALAGAALWGHEVKIVPELTGLAAVTADGIGHFRARMERAR